MPALQGLQPLQGRQVPALPVRLSTPLRSLQGRQAPEARAGPAGPDWEPRGSAGLQGQVSDWKPCGLARPPGHQSDSRPLIAGLLTKQHLRPRPSRY